LLGKLEGTIRFLHLHQHQTEPRPFRLEIAPGISVLTLIDKN
jgi:hypothetical protein